MKQARLAAYAMLLGVLGCGDARLDEPVGDAAESAREVPDEQTAAVLAAEWDARLPPEEVERSRRDRAWRQVVPIDTLPLEPGPENAETWSDISVESVNTAPIDLPLSGDVAGPSVLKAQILLDRALFSPGIIDGYWGANTEKAVYWFQRREGLATTGQLDRGTFGRLVQLAGDPEDLVRLHALSAEDVEGPFVTIPDDIYEQAELDCLCYESLSEKLSELFHTSPAVLAQLNPEVNLDRLAAGDRIRVPRVRAADAGRALEVVRLVVSDRGRYVHALDADERILFHFPSTLGAQYSPSPTGDFRVTSITQEPWWHYQPALLPHIDDDEPDARIPPGPNNAVGLVWMALSIPHYGIHGTQAPETIGYANSAGCVRLTNWDALFLAERIRPGVAVAFRDVES